MAVFVDAGYLIALDNSRDENHAAALRHWREFARSRPALVTTSFVLAETVAFFQRRGQHDKAVEVGLRLLSGEGIELVHVDHELCQSAFDYLQARRDKHYSLTDCASFVMMQRRGIHEALAFDAHFEQAGFVRLPRA
ncbi:MAG TPA: PIN domain-containing protein [Longimicrobium sp.]|nr:PIN domain-containing protein [Longimicrobium sp.]